MASLSDVPFDLLVVKLVAILEIAQRPQGTTTPAAKQELRHAVAEFRDMLNRAKEVANGLPGGEMLIEDQDEVINMLEDLRNKKRAQLAQFSERIVQGSSAATQSLVQEMVQEIDSNASTPAA
ncbi:hypothetical protein K488DRAFT_84064 [Vararia minispora EC-137]|uniref:Uncharacterized protein n=1 Tax=Vararia minispora EC-137 TaxID=1314806 RepID=A0ACB8QS13_9AGAM|nr:hypothetical protein K488DRAFT_84064 [Vararia minispora EC-137]